MRRLTDLAPEATSQGLVAEILEGLAVRNRPTPAPPTATDTAIELPWRLIISPHNGEQWQHASPVPSPGTSHTELWHTRLVGQSVGGRPAVEPPHDDPVAPCAPCGPRPAVGQKAMQQAFPQGFTELPVPTTATLQSFCATLTDYDRYQFSHLSANFAKTNYMPQPMDTRLLMLSSLGGWLDAAPSGTRRASTWKLGAPCDDGA